MRPDLREIQSATCAKAPAGIVFVARSIDGPDG
jgi:hypothetical protein